MRRDADNTRTATTQADSNATGAVGTSGASPLHAQLRQADYATGQALLTPVQMATVRVPMKAAPGEVAEKARAGIEGGGTEVPYLTEMEAAFGTSFADVTAHFGPRAQEACQGIGARAFASGSSIAFAEASPDKELVAHELAHIVQQRDGRAPAGGVGTPGDSLEKEADQMAGRVVAGQPAREGGGRDPAEGGSAAPPHGEAVQMDTDWSYTGFCVVHVDPVPDLVYEKANYWNRSKVVYTNQTPLSMIGTKYEYLAKYAPFSKLAGCDWEGRKAGGGTNITHQRLRTRPADANYSTYTHAIGSTVGSNCKAEEHFKAYRLLQNVEEKGTTEAPSFNHAIPIQSDGSAAIDFSISADSITGTGYALTDSYAEAKHVTESSTSSGGLDLGAVAAKVEKGTTAGEVVKDAISNSKSFQETKTTTGTMKTPIPAGAPTNKLAIPKLRTTTWALSVIPSDSKGKKTGGPKTRYVHHIAPSGAYDLIDASGKADPEPMRRPLPTSELDKAYSDHKREQHGTQAGALSPLVKSFRLIDRKQAVRDLSAQQFVAVDGPDAGEAMSATLGQSKRSTVNEGLTFSMRRTEVASISRRLSAEIGVGSDATKATGISGAIGGAVEKGEQVVNAVSEQLSQSHSDSETISDSRTFQVPAGKTLVAALTPLARVSTYGFELVNGMVVHINRFNYQPTRHSASKLVDKGAGHQVDTTRPWDV